jgi:hypothetical protein
MNLAEQMYKKSKGEKVEEIQCELFQYIKDSTEDGITKLEIDDENYFYDKAINCQDALKLNGFKIEYDTNYDFGQVPTQYIIISWEVA